MFRRWFIRSCFVFPIAMCVIGWVINGWYHGKISYCRMTEETAIGSQWGRVYIIYRGPNWGGDTGLCCGLYRQAGIHFWPPAPSVHKLGFNYSTRGWFFLAVPDWFLILVFSIILFFVWRRTRPKSGAGFPVVVKTGGQT